MREEKHTPGQALYVTKYALSGGLRQIHGLIEKSGYDDTYFVKDGYNFLRMGRDVFDSVDAALSDAETRRIAKIASRRKQIAKLEKLSFAAPTQETQAGDVA